MDGKLIFCFLLITYCCTVTQAEVAMDCCLSVYEGGAIAKGAFVDYRKQISGQGCSIDSTILRTRKGSDLCAPFSEAWVQDVEKHVNFLKKFCKRNSHKKVCDGVRVKN